MEISTDALTFGLRIPKKLEFKIRSINANTGACWLKSIRKCSLCTLNGTAFQVSGTHMKTSSWSLFYVSQWPIANFQGGTENQVSCMVLLPQIAFTSISTEQKSLRITVGSKG